MSIKIRHEGGTETTHIYIYIYIYLSLSIYIYIYSVAILAQVLRYRVAGLSLAVRASLVRLLANAMNSLEHSIPVLLAVLQRETLLCLATATGSRLYGLASGGKMLGLSSLTRRRLREIDALLGWVKKLSMPFIESFVADLRSEIST